MSVFCGLLLAVLAILILNSITASTHHLGHKFETSAGHAHTKLHVHEADRKELAREDDTRRIIELVLIVDHELYSDILGSSMAKANMFCSGVTDFINGVFTNTRITVALKSCVIWSTGNPIYFSGATPIGSIYNQLAEWKSKYFKSVNKYDFLQLMVYRKMGREEGRIMGTDICGDLPLGVVSHGDRGAHDAKQYGLEVAQVLAHSLAVRGCTMFEYGVSSSSNRVRSLIKSEDWATCARDVIFERGFGGFYKCLEDYVEGDDGHHHGH